MKRLAFLVIFFMMISTQAWGDTFANNVFCLMGNDPLLNADGAGATFNCVRVANSNEGLTGCADTDLAQCRFSIRSAACSSQTTCVKTEIMTVKVVSFSTDTYTFTVRARDLENSHRSSGDWAQGDKVEMIFNAEQAKYLPLPSPTTGCVLQSIDGVYYTCPETLNVATLNDTIYWRNATDITKRGLFSMASVGTGTDKTYTFPNTTGYLTTTTDQGAATQVLMGSATAGQGTWTATPSGLTSVGATTFTGALTGNATTATAASGLACTDCVQDTEIDWGTGAGQVDGSDIPWTQTGTGAVATTVDAKLKSSAKNVRDFGAVCDGSTDDTLKIQAAIDAVGVIGNGAIYIPDKCRITAKLVINTSNITLFGDGASSSQIIKAADFSTATDPMLKIGPTTPSGINYLYDISIRDLGFVATADTTGGSAILVDGVFKFQASNLIVKDTFGGFDIRAGNTYEFSNIAVWSGKYFGITDTGTFYWKYSVGDAGFTYRWPSAIFMNNIQMKTSETTWDRNYAIYNGMILNDIDGLMLSNFHVNHYFNNGMLMSPSSTFGVHEVLISNSYFDGAGGTGGAAVALEATSANSITGVKIANTLFHGSNDTSITGIKLNSAGLTDFSLIGSKIYGWYNDGIDILAGTNITIDGNFIDRNNAADSTYSGIVIANDLVGISLLNNKIGFSSTHTQNYGVYAGTGLTKFNYFGNTFGDYNTYNESINTTPLAILVKGKLGIGTTAPSVALELGTTTVGQSEKINSTLGADLSPALTGATGVNWDFGAGYTTPLAGTIIKSGDGTTTITPTAATTIVAGTVYKVTINVSAWSVGSATYTLGGVNGTPLIAATTYVDYITALTTDKLIITPTNTSRFTIDTINIIPLAAGNLTMDGKLSVQGDANIMGYVSTPKLFFKENGLYNGTNTVYITERSLSTSRRIVLYGDPQSNTFGFIVAPTGTTKSNITLGLWTTDIDAGGISNSGGISLNGSTDSSNLLFYTGIADSDNGDIIFSPKVVEAMRIQNGGKVGIGTAAPGTNNKLEVKDGIIAMTQTTKPTCAMNGTSCTCTVTGSSLATNDTDESGTMTAASCAGASTTATLTFGYTHAKAPVCIGVVKSPTPAFAYNTTRSTTAPIFDFASQATNPTIDYICR